MSTFTLNGKTFNYDAVKKNAKIGVTALFKPTPESIALGEAELKYENCSPNDSDSEVVIYHYKGQYIVLVGLERVKKVLAEKGEMKARLFTKHSLNKFEIVQEVKQDSYVPASNPWDNAPARPYREYNRSGGYSGYNGDRGGYGANRRDSGYGAPSDHRKPYGGGDERGGQLDGGFRSPFGQRSGNMNGRNGNR